MKKTKKIEYEWTCDVCGKKADYNLQDVWKLWEINNDVIDNEPSDEWEGDTNEFYCAKCYEKI